MNRATTTPLGDDLVNAIKGRYDTLTPLGEGAYEFLQGYMAGMIQQLCEASPEAKAYVDARIRWLREMTPKA